MKGKRGTVNLTHKDGSVWHANFPALIYGAIAVHKDPAYLKDWRLTHIPTGGYLMICTRTRKEAIAAAEELNSLPFDWNSITTPCVHYHLTRDQIKAVKEVITRYADR